MLKDFVDKLLNDYNDFVANNNSHKNFLLLQTDCYIYTEEHPHLPSDPYWKNRYVRLYTNIGEDIPKSVFNMQEQEIKFNIPNVRFTIYSQ